MAAPNRTKFPLNSWGMPPAPGLGLVDFDGFFLYAIYFEKIL